MSDQLHCDFETKSTIDLRATGVYVYAQHPTTDVWCMAYAFNDEPVQMWAPDQPIPPRVERHLREGGEICCFNASFERIIMWAVMTPRYKWPRPKLEQFTCVMAMAQAMAFPGSLENAAAAAGIDIAKDMGGKRVMLQLCRPRKIEEDGTVVWWDDPERIDRLKRYCETDILVERALHKRLQPLSPTERKVYALSERANDRGIVVDLELCRQAQKIIETTTKALDAEMRKVTDGDVASCGAVQQLVKWLKTQGVNTSSVNKETVIDLLGEDLPPAAEKALKLRQEAAKASTAKIEAFIARTSPDGRMRGNLCYHGANTGRWAGRGGQLQNLPGPSVGFKATPDDIALLRSGDVATVGMFYDRPLTFVADCIRSLLIAPKGKDLIASDFANIEGRVLAWLAGQKDAIDLFANNGPAYERMGAAIFGVSLESVLAKGKSSPERDLGKRAMLGCGYQMGAPKFKATCKKEGQLIIPIDMAVKAVSTFRNVNDRIVVFWSSLEQAAIEAMRNPGTVASYGRIKYRKHGSFLVCQLPSGRCLYYPYPRLVKNVWILDLKTNTKRTMRLEVAREAQSAKLVRIDGDPYDSLVYKGVDTYTKKWQEIDTYGGKLVENVTQAVARDLMADAMLRIEAAGYPVILTVHDEVLSEPAEGVGSQEEFDALMVQSPAWATGCPVAAEGWRGKRYRK